MERREWLKMGMYIETESEKLEKEDGVKETRIVTITVILTLLYFV